MTTKAGLGMSRHHNPNVAGREAAEQALEKAGVSKPDFVIMFGSIGYDQHSLSAGGPGDYRRGIPLGLFGRGHDRRKRSGRIQFLGIGYGSLFGGAAVDQRISDRA